MTGDVKRYFSGSKFEALYGHCRAVAVGNLIFVAGSTGYDYETGTISDDPAEHVERAFLLVTGHSPTQQQRTTLIRYADEFGTENLCRLLFNLNEFVYVD